MKLQNMKKIITPKCFMKKQYLEFKWSFAQRRISSKTWPSDYQQKYWNMNLKLIVDLSKVYFLMHYEL